MAEMALAALLEVSGVWRKKDAPPIFLNEKQTENSAPKKENIFVVEFELPQK